MKRNQIRTNSSRNYRKKLRRTFCGLVAAAVFFSALSVSLLLYRYTGNEIRSLRMQNAEQDMRTVRMQLSGINEALLSLSASGSATLLRTAREQGVKKTQAILDISRVLKTTLASTEGVKQLFYYVPSWDLIVSYGSEAADTYLYYNLTASWEEARALKERIGQTDQLVYLPCPAQVAGANRVFEILPVPLSGSSARGFLCAVFELRLEPFVNGLDDIKMIVSGEKVLSFVAPEGFAEGELSSFSAPQGASVRIGGGKYTADTFSIGFGGLQYCYLTSDASLARTVRIVALLTLAAFLILGAAVLLITTRATDLLYRPVSSLISAMAAQGKFPPGQDRDELSAIGRVIDEVISDNQEMERTLNRISPMMDTAILYAVLHHQETAGAGDRLLFHEKTLQLFLFRFSNPALSDALYSSETLRRIQSGLSSALNEKLNFGQCRLSILDESVYLILAYSLPEARFRVTAANLINSVLQEIVRDWGVSITYAVSLPFSCAAPEENVRTLRTMNEQCEACFDAAYLRSEIDNGIWFDDEIVTEPDHTLSHVPAHLAGSMIAMLHDRKIHECCELTEALLTERLCGEGMTGSIMKKLLFECLDLLFQGLDGSRAAIGEYAACVQYLNRCGTFRDAAGYLYSLYDLAAEALQPAGTQRPFGKEELDSYIQNHWNEDISLADAAAFFGLSGGYFSRIVRELAGKSFPDYLNGLRIARAEKLMRESDYSLAEISERCGFYSYKTFTRAFRKAYSLSPGEYRKGQSRARPVGDAARRKPGEG